MAHFPQVLAASPCPSPAAPLPSGQGRDPLLAPAPAPRSRELDPTPESQRRLAAAHEPPVDEPTRSVRGALLAAPTAGEKGSRLDPRAAALLVRARLSDPEFLASLGKLVRRRVRAQEVDDVLQETALAALSSRALPETAAEVDGWICGISQHKARDQVRSRYLAAHGESEAREKQGADPPPALTAAPRPGGAPEPPAHAPGSALEARGRLERILSRLPDEPWVARALDWAQRRADGETVEAIAVSEGLTARQVHHRLRRLREAAELAERM